MVHTRKSKVFESVLLFVSARENPPKTKREIVNETADHLIFAGIFLARRLIWRFCWGVEYELGTVGESQDWLVERPSWSFDHPTEAWT